MRCSKMPRKLRDWEAYTALRTDITDFQDMLPLLQELAKPSIKPRHWAAIMQITGARLPTDLDLLKLHMLWEARMLDFKEEVEEVTDGADKQLAIEAKLGEIKEKWAADVFTFDTWKSRKVPVLQGFGQVIEDLEDTQLALQTMLSMRHVTPFKEEVTFKLAQLSDTADTLERWVKVQMLWMSLESVFTGGDIAKQMPLEAKKFAKIDKDFVKIMEKAAETAGVVNCCANELLRNTLPILYNELEKCQMSLEGYPEQ